MPNKSHVSLAQKVCIVCLETYDTGEVLLHRRLAKVLNPTTTTGYGICPIHQQLHDEGYVALIGGTPTMSTDAGKPVNNEDVIRSGHIAHIKRDVAVELGFPEELIKMPAIFVDQAVIQWLEQLENERKATEED